MAFTVKQKVKAAAWAVVATAVATSPITVSAATQTADTTVNATVNKVISISSVSPVNFTMTPTAGGVVSSASDTVTVSTNSSNGYNLTLANVDATTSLASGGNTITAHAGTQASPTTLANGTWGYRVVGVGGFGAGAYTGETDQGSSTSTWAGVPASGSANTLKTTGVAATNDVTTVWYGAKVTTAQASGTYTDVVRYTATTN